MSILDRIKKAEEQEQNANTSSGGFKFNPLIYPKLILSKGTPKEPDPAYITFLTDWNRSLPIEVHFNESTRSMDLCDILNDKPTCETCTKAKAWEAANKSKGKERGMNPFGTSKFRLFIVYNHNRVGKKVLNEDGSIKYEEEAIQIYEQRAGEGGENYTVLRDANGMDPNEYYDDMGPGQLPDVQPDRLKDCELMYLGADDRIWSVAKVVAGADAQGKGGKTSYRVPTSVTQKQAREKLGKEATLRVPKAVRDHFNQQTIMDLVPFYLAHYTKVDKDAWDIEDIVEGQKLQTVEPRPTANTVL